MHNFWLVARHEYRRIAGKRSFLLLTLAIPLAMAALIGVAVWIERGQESSLPVGYVDRQGFLDEGKLAELASPGDTPPARAYPDEAAARAALENGEIQAFFVFPPGYLDTRRTELYYLDQPPGNRAWRAFDGFVRLNLVADFPPDVRERLLEGPQVTVHDIASGRQFGQNAVINIVIPFVASALFMFATMSASGYMLQAVTDEKENRMMEIVLTSLTPGQLIGGKAAGLLGVALTQLGIYLASVVIGAMVAMPYVEELRQASFPWLYLGIMALFFFPSYALFSALMVAVGAAVSELQQGQQLAGLLNMLFLLPMFLLAFMFEDPASPWVVVLSLFPPSAFLTISLRWGLGSVPAWQIGLSWVLLAGAAAFMIWAAAKVFRIGMLSYGQPLHWKTILNAALREA